MSPAPAWAARTARVLGFVLLVPVGILYLASGLVVPQPWLVGVWALGIAMVVYAVWQRHRPWRVLATPIVAVLVWVAVVTLGDVLLDWTA